MKIKKSNILISFVLSLAIASILTIRINVFITLFISLLTFAQYFSIITIITTKGLIKKVEFKKILSICIIFLVEFYLLLILTCYELSNVITIILISIFLIVGVLSALYALFKTTLNKSLSNEENVKKEGKKYEEGKQNS